MHTSRRKISFPFMSRRDGIPLDKGKVGMGMGLQISLFEFNGLSMLTAELPHPLPSPCMFRFVVFIGLNRGDEMMAGRMSRGPWNKCERGFFLSRLCRESLLTSFQPDTLEAVVGDGFFIPSDCLTASAGFGAAPQGVGCSLSYRSWENEFGRQRIARQPFGTPSP